MSSALNRSSFPPGRLVHPSAGLGVGIRLSGYRLFHFITFRLIAQLQKCDTIQQLCRQGETQGDRQARP